MCDRRKEMLKGSSSTPTVDTADKPVQEQMTSDSDDHQLQDVDTEELSYEEEWVSCHASSFNQ